MDTEASGTALTAAAARAAHLIVDDEPRIFADPLAAALLGDRAAELTGYHTMHGTHPVLAGARVQVTCRSRYTEQALARARAGGVRQYVILGAGLDSFGYRDSLDRHNRCDDPLRVFEVDHPASQDYKRAALAAAGIPVPDSVAFVPADLAADSLAGCLAAAGFDAAAPAVIGWLGVTMYLTQEAVTATMTAIAGLAPGSELIADYMLPDGSRDEDGALYGALVAQASAERGEPWLSCFTPAEMADLAARAGFGDVRAVSQRDAIPALLWQRTDALKPAVLAMLFHGTVSGR
ncbi:MAG TPA: SAM-dependent methyltransferase [Trebonia sp.]|nr:SAM-dependent methyltransferase [Trebonia sp.]